MKKILLLILIAIASIAAVYALVHYTKMDSFAFAWALNFLLMLCVLVFTETLNSPLHTVYFQQKRWEKKGKIYEHAGINFFRKLLVWTGWEKLNKKSNPVEKNTEVLMNLCHQTKKSELNHVIIFFIVMGFNLFVAVEYGIIKSLWLLALNVLLNLYPVFLQRYNRPRIERILNFSKGS